MPGLRTSIRAQDRTTVVVSPLTEGVQWHQFPLTEHYVFGLETRVSSGSNGNDAVKSKMALFEDKAGKLKGMFFLISSKSSLWELSCSKTSKRCFSYQNKSV